MEAVKWDWRDTYLSSPTSSTSALVTSDGGAGWLWISSAATIGFSKMKLSPCFRSSYTKAFCGVPSCLFSMQLCQNPTFSSSSLLGFYILTSGPPLPSWLQMRPSKLVTKPRSNLNSVDEAKGCFSSTASTLVLFLKA